MEVVSLESEVYKDLINRLNRIENYVERTSLLLNEIEDDLEVTTKDLVNILSVSESTLYRWRKKQLIRYRYTESGDVRFYFKSIINSFATNKIHISGYSNADVVSRLNEYKESIIVNACLNFKEK